MSGIAKVLADVLRNDTLSTQASAYVAAYPTIFSAASAVPLHFYTSLKDIWTTGTTITNWSTTIVDTYGYGESGTRTIDVVPVRILDGIDGPEGFPASNTTGSRFAEIYILFKIAGVLAPADVDRITNAELRIQRLLDYNYRCNLLGNSEIPVNAPSIVNPNEDLKAYWQGFKNAPINDKEVLSCWYVSYCELRLK